MKRLGVNSVALAVVALTAFSVFAQHAAAQELIGYWKFEETSVDDAAVDSSGNGIDGFYEGDIDPNVDGAPGFGSGAFFDGETAQVLLGPGDENGFGDLTSGYSVMAWINPDQLETKNRVFGSSPWEANAGWGWGTVGDQLEITTWGVRDYDQPVPVEVDEWAHVAVVMDEDFSSHFYHNGEFVGTQEHPTEGGPTTNDFYIGFAATPVSEHFSGLLDEVGVFLGELSEEQINNAMNLGVDGFNGQVDPWLALDDGSLTDPIERVSYIHDVLGTWVGDSNRDGVFDSSDFVFVFTAGEYEDDIPGNSTWATGDWNGDMDFDSSDFVAAFSDGGFEMGERAAVAAVPEPSGLLLLLVGVLPLIRRR